eukprot:jgi/Mesvir1/1227/Mv17712-RA.1
MALHKVADNKLRQLLQDIEVEIRSSYESASSSSRASPHPGNGGVQLEDKMAMVRALLREMELSADDADGNDERGSILRDCQRHQEHYQRLRTEQQNTALRRKAARALAHQAERDALLGGTEVDALRLRRAQKERDAVSVAEDVTAALRRTRQLMVHEIERGVHVAAAVDSSNATLGKVEREYLGQSPLLARARHLLNTLQRLNTGDRFILLAGFVLFSLVVVYIIYKRLVRSR